MNPALQGLITIIIGVGGCLAYFYGSNTILDRVIFRPKPGDHGKNIRRAEMVRPWLFLLPAIVALGVYLAYPVFETLRLSVSNRLPGGRSEFAGLENYIQMFGEPKFHEALTNNMLWLIVVPAASTAMGLLVAQLTDRIAWGALAKSLIFMPMAISFVGAAVIFKLIYEARDADAPQIGVMNAVWLQFDGGVGSVIFLKILPILLLLAFGGILLYLAWILIRPVIGGDGGGGIVLVGRLVGAAFAAILGAYALIQIIDVLTADYPYGEPQNWLTIPIWNSFFLMVVLIWIQTGFAMVILSAAIRGIPEDTVEAAVVDGANPLQIFFRIKIPQIMGTIVVVWTTITIVVLKVFDIVFAMTNGQWETQVLANYMYDKLFRANDWGVGSAAAMIIMLLVTPILFWNVYNARKEMR